MNTLTAPRIVINSFPRRSPELRDDIAAKDARITARLAAQKRLPLAPAFFIGVQQGFGPIPDTEMFNLTADITPEHRNGSTVSRATLEKAGYYVPPISPARINQANAGRVYGELTA